LAALVASDEAQPKLSLPNQVASSARATEGNVARKYAKSFRNAFLRPASRHQRRAIDSAEQSIRNRPPFGQISIPERLPEGWKEIKSSILTPYPVRTGWRESARQALSSTMV
jgi:hypothetical protein